MGTRTFWIQCNRAFKIIVESVEFSNIRVHRHLWEYVKSFYGFCFWLYIVLLRKGHCNTQHERIVHLRYRNWKLQLSEIRTYKAGSVLDGRKTPKGSEGSLPLAVKKIVSNHRSEAMKYCLWFCTVRFFEQTEKKLNRWLNSPNTCRGYNQKQEQKPYERSNRSNAMLYTMLWFRCGSL